LVHFITEDLILHEADTICFSIFSELYYKIR